MLESRRIKLTSSSSNSMLFLFLISSCRRNWSCLSRTGKLGRSCLLESFEHLRPRVVAASATADQFASAGPETTHSPLKCWHMNTVFQRYRGLDMKSHIQKKVEHGRTTMNHSHYDSYCKLGKLWSPPAYSGTARCPAEPAMIEFDQDLGPLVKPTTIIATRPCTRPFVSPAPVDAKLFSCGAVMTGNDSLWSTQRCISFWLAVDTSVHFEFKIDRLHLRKVITVLTLEKATPLLLRILLATLQRRLLAALNEKEWDLCAGL